jgi:hypothetical protein
MEVTERPMKGAMKESKDYFAQATPINPPAMNDTLFTNHYDYVHLL